MLDCLFLINNPDLALDPQNAVKIAVKYFKDRHINNLCEQKDWERVRRAVNGGLKKFVYEISNPSDHSFAVFVIPL